MTPSDDPRRDREAFDALPGGTPPPGLDTRIRAEARAAVGPTRRVRLTALAGSLATVVLAALLIRPLWHNAPDTVTTPAAVTADVAAVQADAVAATKTVEEDAVAFERAENAVAAVADTRNRSFDAKQTLGAQSGADTAAVFSRLAKSSVAETARQVEAIESASDATGVSADTWWAQISTLLEHGHTDKAQREFRLLREAHPDFELPDGVSAAQRAALGLPTAQPIR